MKASHKPTYVDDTYKLIKMQKELTTSNLRKCFQKFPDAEKNEI